MIKNWVASEFFSIADLIASLFSGAIWILSPQAGWWPALIALLPWLARLVFGRFPLPKTLFDAGIGIFLVSAWVGSQVAYDPITAQNKFWFIVGAAFIAYAVARQSPKMIGWLSAGMFTLGVAGAVYFFMTHDFIAEPRKWSFINQLGVIWMGIRPELRWTPVHPNYAAGLAAICSLFGLLPLWKYRSNGKSSAQMWIIGLGYLIVIAGLIAETSRGAWMALAGAAGLYAFWLLLQGYRRKHPRKIRWIFPTLALLYVGAVVLLVFLGPAQSGSDLAASVSYGSGSRAELFRRSLPLVMDFPFTGGGLGAFPGLYSHYILSIPYFYLINSHNLFLDVAIEQGLIGGLIYLMMFLGCVWIVARSIVTENDAERRVFLWSILMSIVVAIVHGQVDDYLYNGKGAVLTLLLVGFSMWVLETGRSQQSAKKLMQNQDSSSIPERSLVSSGIWVSLVVLLVFSVGLVRLNHLRAAWYANWGAVHMARYDLVGFPDRGWNPGKDVEQLIPVEASFRKALQYDPYNLTANHRLGLIYMLRKEFESALPYLELAYQLQPEHRGIVKNLGYCLVWLDEMGVAKEFLVHIPEAQDELDVYTWWWASQGLDLYSERASKMAAQISSGK